MIHFKTLRSFQFPAEYAVLKLLLDQAHIRYFFQNETFISILPFTPYSQGGIHLKVHEQDFEKAAEILEKLYTPAHLRKV